MASPFFRVGNMLLYETHYLRSCYGKFARSLGAG
jgi:hypothetical protein